MITMFFLLMSSMIGIGFLTLPVICKTSGIIFGIIILLVAACFSLLGSIQLVKAFSLFPSKSYSDLVKNILGKKNFLAINFFLYFYVMFSTTIFIYFTFQLFKTVLLKYNIMFPENLKIVFVVSVGVLTFSLCLIKLQDIKFLSYIGNFFSLYTAILLIVELPIFYKTKQDYVPLKYFDINLNFFVNMGAALFSFTNQFAVINVSKGLKNSNSLGYITVLIRSFYFPIFLYIMVMISGYISFGEDLPQFIILREAPTGYNDIMMNIGLIGIIISLIIGITIRINCNTNTLYVFLSNFELFNNVNFESLPKVTSLGLFLTNILIPVFLSLLITEDILSIISLFTSILCPYFMIICPCLLTLKLKKKYGYSKKFEICIYVYLALVLTLVFISIGTNIYSLISGNSVIA